jgi:hypothetical protein
MDPAKLRAERAALRLLLAALAAPLLYLMSACVVFDLGSTAWDDSYEGAAHGPHPRLLLCRPCRFDWPGGASWDGSEWAFRAYTPICSAWLKVKGLERPPRRQD